MEKGELKWAVIGCGVIANEMAQALSDMGRRLYAVANRTHEKAVAFAEKYGVEKVYGAIDEVFADPEVDIIYLTTPHNTHYEYMKKALASGKHLLVEKSITLNSRELEEASAFAERRGLIIGEAMTIWHMPLYKELWRIVESGELGRVQIMTLNFGSFKEYDMKNRFFNMDLAGGALLDIGVYALSLIRSFMTEKPEEVLSQWLPSPTGSDDNTAEKSRRADGYGGDFHALKAAEARGDKLRKGLHRDNGVPPRRQSPHSGRRNRRGARDSGGQHSACAVLRIAGHGSRRAQRRYLGSALSAHPRRDGDNDPLAKRVGA